MSEGDVDALTRPFRPKVRQFYNEHFTDLENKARAPSEEAKHRNGYMKATLEVSQAEAKKVGFHPKTSPEEWFSPPRRKKR